MTSHVQKSQSGQNRPCLRQNGEALFQAGQLFTPTRDGLNSQLARLLQEAGLQNVQTRAHRLSLDAGTTQGEHFAEDTRLAFPALLPFMRKWGQVPDDYEEIYQQMLHEMQQPGFVATWSLLTVWGTNHR